MTRGRRKDLSIPPSRALLQQRDYRARKARYVAELEDRCRKAEEENARLRDELDALTARLHAAGQTTVQRASPSPEMAAATSDLMQHLSATASSIARFQRVALHPAQEPSSSSMLQLPPIHAHTPTSLATPSFTPSPIPQPPRRLPSPRSRIELPPLHTIHRDLYRAEPASYAPPLRHGKAVDRAPVGYSESECCGGYVDCDGLVDEDEDEEGTEEGGSDPRSRLAQRMSDMRSTTSSSGPDDNVAHSGRIPR